MLVSTPTGRSRPDLNVEMKLKSVASNPFVHDIPEVQSEKYVVFADSHRRYVACSQGVCDLLGYSENEILSKTIDQLSFFTSDVPAMFDRFVQRGALDGMYLLRHKDGRPISIRYRSWTFDDGCLAAALGASRQMA